MTEALRFPTMAELELGYAIQCADDAARALAPRPREPRDQDVVSEPPRTPPTVPQVFCAHCGLVFDHYATKGMRVLQLRKHEKAKHSESVEAY